MIDRTEGKRSKSEEGKGREAGCLPRLPQAPPGPAQVLCALLITALSGASRRSTAATLWGAPRYPPYPPGPPAPPSLPTNTQPQWPTYPPLSPISPKTVELPGACRPKVTGRRSGESGWVAVGQWDRTLTLDLHGLHRLQAGTDLRQMRLMANPISAQERLVAKTPDCCHTSLL